MTVPQSFEFAPQPVFLLAENTLGEREGQRPSSPAPDGADRHHVRAARALRSADLRARL